MEDTRLAVLRQDSLFVAGVFTAKGIYSVNLPATTEKQAIESVGGVGIIKDERPEDMCVLKSVFDVIKGKSVDMDSLSFDFSGLTEKQVKVLKATLEIPIGETRTYGEVAKSAGIPNAARFVGNVMASNRFPPLIPCHRVVGAKGLGGYGAGCGIATKKAILHAECVLAE